jgi:uncharacterized membrane protein YkvA (DUF1232 family)
MKKNLNWDAIVDFMLDGKAPIGPKLFIILAIVYIISPADVLPDVFPIIGWIDDLGLTGIAIFILSRAVNRYISGKDKKTEA